MARLIDELKEHFGRRGSPLAGELQVIGSFADLFWGVKSADEMLKQMDAEPAVKIEGYTRYLALARINGELRYFAAPLSAHPHAEWYQKNPDEARAASIRLEARVVEGGHVETVEAAGALIEKYLAGEPLADIPVHRIIRARC